MERVSTDEEDETETPAQKRLRLAKVYLDGLKQSQRGTLPLSMASDTAADVSAEEDGGFDAAEIDRELISSRLRQDVVRLRPLVALRLFWSEHFSTSQQLETTGKVHAFVASRIPSTSAFTVFKTGRNQHRLPITCAVASDDGNYLYAAGKEGSIVKYDMNNVWRLAMSSEQASEGTLRRVAVMERSRPPHANAGSSKAQTKGKGRAKPSQPGVSQASDTQQGHIGEVLSIAISGNGKILASGGKDRLIGVWDVSGEKAEWRRGLRGHKDTIAVRAKVPKSTSVLL